MFEELGDISSIDVGEIENAGQKNNYSNSGNNWQNRNNSNNNGGGNNWQNRSNGQGGVGQSSSNKWPKKEDKVEKPYIPVTIYVDREFPPEVKTSLYNIGSKLIAKGITVRVNGDDKEFITKLQSLSDVHVEVYIPWRNFNEINSKHYFNSLTSKDIAAKHFQAWDRIPDAVKAMLARNIRMIFGDKNNSITLCLITWTQDGAGRVSEITKDTGKASFIIRAASSYGFPVVNIAKQTAENILEKTFGL